MPFLLARAAKRAAACPHARLRPSKFQEFQRNSFALFINSLTGCGLSFLGHRIVNIDFTRFTPKPGGGRRDQMIGQALGLPGDDDLLLFHWHWARNTRPLIALFGQALCYGNPVAVLSVALGNPIAVRNRPCFGAAHGTPQGNWLRAMLFLQAKRFFQICHRTPHKFRPVGLIPLCLRRGVGRRYARAWKLMSSYGKNIFLSGCVGLFIPDLSDPPLGRFLISD